MDQVQKERAVDGDAIIKKAVVLACLTALFLSAYLAYALASQDNYASIYLVPNSYSNYLDGENVKFAYGIQQQGRESSAYHLDIYVGDALVESKDLTQHSSMNEVMLKVSEDMMLPTNVSLVLNTDSGTSEVHFWLKDIKGDTSTLQ